MVDIYLRKLELSDVTDDYLSWMNDYETVKYTESRFTHHTKESLAQFVLHANSETSCCFAIVDKRTEKHIGNIKIGGINTYHKFADVGLIIGEKSFWGKGVATQSIKLVLEYAFSTLGLHRLEAGIYDGNTGSIKAFEKAGFTLESCVRSKYFFEGTYIDACIYSIISR